MGLFIHDGFSFSDGFFNAPVFNMGSKNIEEEIEYILRNQISRIAFDSNLQTFSFLEKMSFVEEVYLPRAQTNDYSAFYGLKKLKRIIVNIDKKEPHLDYSNFPLLEYLSIDWYSNFPDLSKNTHLKDLVIWKFRPQSKSLYSLQLPGSLTSLEITDSNISDLKGLSLPSLKRFEAHHCKALQTLDGIDGFAYQLECLIFDYCKNLTHYDALANCHKLRKIILGDCGSIPTISWLRALRYVKHFSFWGTDLTDGDIEPCFGISYVSFKDKKHYNHKLEEFK